MFFERKSFTSSKLALILISLGLFLEPQSFAADLIPSSIPLEEDGAAATGLRYQGKPLQPDEAKRLWLKGAVKDLADLPPDESTEIWSDQFPKKEIDDYASMSLKPDGDELTFVVASRTVVGRAAALVEKRLPDGSVKTYRLVLDAKAHNQLARKSLLRKIGYRVPSFVRLPRVKLKFRGYFAKNDFFREVVQRKILTDGRRWFDAEVEGSGTDLALKDRSDTLDLIDVLVYSGSADEYYNLATGNMDPDRINNDRLIGSTIVVNSLTDAPESLNLNRPCGQAIFNNRIQFLYEFSELFSLNYSDAKWMARRLLKLSREDWVDVVKAAQMPKEPEALYLEQMLSHRQCLREQLHLEKESADIPANITLSLGDRLQEGKLLGDREFSGYARRFIGIDPPSPLNIGEMWGLGKSKLLSNVISNGMSEINKRYLPHTDLAYKVFDHQLDLAAKQFVDFLVTKKPKEIPFGVWSTKFQSIDLILSREIVAGNYLGADNGKIVQLAQTLGFVGQWGRFYWAEGMPAKQNATGMAGVRLMHSFTHLKPVSSIKATLDEPFPTIVVPWSLMKTRSPLEGLLELEEKIKSGALKEGDEKTAGTAQFEINKLMDEFSKSLGVGESYVMSTSIAPNVNIDFTKAMARAASAYVSFKAQLVGLSRIQLFRADEKTIHIYFDLAGYPEVEAAIGFRARIPLVEWGIKAPFGMGQTAFYKFDLDSSSTDRQKLFNGTAALLALFKGGGQSALKNFGQPWQFQHDFAERRPRFDVLVWKNTWSTLTHTFTAQKPSGETQDYVRRISGERHGIEYEGLLVDVTNALIEHYRGGSVKLSSNTSDNPAFTVWGRAVSRQVVGEARVAHQDRIDLNEAFFAVDYAWRGWKMDPKGIRSILGKITQTFGTALFDERDFALAKNVQLYSFEVRVGLYKAAIEHILSLSNEEVERLFVQHSKNWSANNSDTYSAASRPPWATWVIGDLAQARAAFAKNDHPLFVKKMVSVVEVVESQLDFAGFRKFVGNTDDHTPGFMVRGQLKGFREGPENGDQPVIAKTIGEVGAANPDGPIVPLIRASGVSANELLLYWLVNPL